MQKFWVSVPIALLAVTMLAGCPAHPRLDVTTTSIHLTANQTTATFTLGNSCWRPDCVLEYTIATDRPWLAVDTVQGQLGGNEQVVVTVTVPAKKAAWSAGVITITSNGGDCTIAVTAAPNYLTQSFGAGLMDLENTTVRYIPNGSRNYYRTEVQAPVFNYPTTPLAGAVGNAELPSFLFGNPVLVQPLDQKQVWFYGMAYDMFYVGSNGRITFEDPGDVEGLTPLEAHFATPGISGLEAIFGPGGTISATQEVDRIAITFDDVPQANVVGPTSNNFQVELFFDTEEIHITWLDVDDDIMAVVGLSQGLAAGQDTTGDGVPDDYTDSDLSKPIPDPDVTKALGAEL